MISRASFSPGVPVAFVATSQNFPDALSGAPVAGMIGGPVLLTPPSGLPSVVATELARLEPGQIVVLGGSGVVPTAVLQSLKAYTTGSVTRLSGATRIETSVAISEAAFSPGVPVAYLATSGTFPDALSGAPVAGVTGGPVLLTPTSALPSAVAAELARLKPGRIVVLGGTGAVTTATLTAASAYVRGSLSGTVTDAGGTHQGLLWVSVEIHSPSTGFQAWGETDSEGRYVIDDVLAVQDYQVCFWAEDARGGSSTRGYLNECYDGAPGGETATGKDWVVPGATLVAVRPGSARTGIDASLRAAGAISGTVTEAGGTHHGLTGIDVIAYSASWGNDVIVPAAADGTYVIKGLPEESDFTVCFYPHDVTGGAHDDLGYIRECYDDQSFLSPDHVSVTPGSTASGIDAALAIGGTITGTVRSSASGHPPIAGVTVNAFSSSTADWASGETAPDGTYTIRGLATASDYAVSFCLFETFVCEQYDNVGFWDKNPTKVSVVAGGTTSGIDAFLAPK